MRAKDPVSGVPNRGRYHSAIGINNRYVDLVGKGDAGSMETKPVTLEDEALANGWTPNNRPTGNDESLIGLYTLGLRGEPGIDDDPTPAPDGRGYVKPTGYGTGTSGD